MDRPGAAQTRIVLSISSNTHARSIDRYAAFVKRKIPRRAKKLWLRHVSRTSITTYARAKICTKFYSVVVRTPTAARVPQPYTDGDPYTILPEKRPAPLTLGDQPDRPPSTGISSRGLLAASYLPVGTEWKAVCLSRMCFAAARRPQGKSRNRSPACGWPEIVAPLPEAWAVPIPGRESHLYTGHLRALLRLQKGMKKRKPRLLDAHNKRRSRLFFFVT